MLRQVSERGARHVVVVIMAEFYDRTTVQRYRAMVDEAVRALAVTDLTVSYSDSPESHEGFVRANAEHIRALQLPAAKLLFTAHSVPTAVGQSSGYVASFESAAARIAQELGVASYRCVYQSRSGAPTDSWLEPDVCDALREEVAQRPACCSRRSVLSAITWKSSKTSISKQRSSHVT